MTIEKSQVSEKLKHKIRDIYDYPKEGIIFKDITPVLLDYQLCREVIDTFYNLFKNMRIDAVAGVESRGFWFGMALAQKFKVPFVPVRKEGKLPHKTISHSYELEYGYDTLEIHADAIHEDWNVLIHDDLLALGGTAAATSELVKMQHANIAGYAFLIELAFLHGRDKIAGYSDKIMNLATYE